MAVTKNITRYVCDRCGASAYLPDRDPRSSEWHPVQRVTSDGALMDLLLCSACHKNYRSLAVQQDGEYNRWMIPTAGDKEEQA